MHNITLLIIATTNLAHNLPLQAIRSGRLDRGYELSIQTRQQRSEILKIMTQSRPNFGCKWE